MPTIYYRKSYYKYHMAYQYSRQTGIKPPQDIFTRYIKLYKNGLLVLEEHYGWNGMSGPIIDTNDTMCGSAEHDALYRLMRWGLLPQSYLSAVDDELDKVLEADGVWKFRRKYVQKGLDFGGAGSASPRSKLKIYVAP